MNIFYVFALIWLPYISLACLLHFLTGLFVYLSLNIYLGLKINIHLWCFYSPQRLFLLNCSPSSLYKIMSWSNCDVIIYLMRVLVPSKENTACLCFRSWNWLIPIISLLYMNCFIFKSLFEKTCILRTISQTSPWRNLNYILTGSQSQLDYFFVYFGSPPINHYMCRFVYVGEGASYAVFGGWVMGTGACVLYPLIHSSDVLIIEFTWFTKCMIIDQCHKFVRHGIFLTWCPYSVTWN